MTIINIHTTTSTNDYVKELLHTGDVENFTVVQAMYQTHGRGQMGNTWQSEKGKNLIFSILIKELEWSVSQQFNLITVVTLSVVRFLRMYYPSISIKWPNDIMADAKKIGGILIENSVKGQRIQHSIVGIGINLNQSQFDDLEHKAVSLRQLTGKSYDVIAMTKELQHVIIKQVTATKSENYHEQYLKNLWGINQKMTFRLPNQTCFSGKIIDVNTQGQLVVEKETGETQCFDFKKIQYGYTLP